MLCVTAECFRDISYNDCPVWPQCCLFRCSVVSLCDPMDCSPPGSAVHGIFQASILEWVAISFSRKSSWARDWTQVSCFGRQILYHLNHLGSPGTLGWRWGRGPEVYILISPPSDFDNAYLSLKTSTVQWLGVGSFTAGSRFDPWWGNSPSCMVWLKANYSSIDELHMCTCVCVRRRYMDQWIGHI